MLKYRLSGKENIYKNWLKITLDKCSEEENKVLFLHTDWDMLPILFSGHCWIHSVPPSTEAETIH